MKNKTLKLLMLLILVNLTACVSVGPTIYIDTEEPTDDFIVNCTWSSVTKSLASGNRSHRSHRSDVLSSHQEYSCGIAIGGGSSVSVQHPLYPDTGPSNRRTESGAYIIKPISMTQKLDKCEKQYKEGYWGKFGPEFDYANCIKYSCGRVSYAMIKLVQKKRGKEFGWQYFKDKYDEPLLSCYQYSMPIVKKYLSNSYRQPVPTAEEEMEAMWKRARYGVYRGEK